MDYKRACLISKNNSAVRWDVTTKSPQNPYPDKTTITVKKDEKYKSGYKIVQRNKVDGKHQGDEVRLSRRFIEPEKYDDWKPSKHSKPLREIMLLIEKLFNEIKDKSILKDEDLKNRIPQIIQYHYERLVDSIPEG